LRLAIGKLHLQRQNINAHKIRTRAIKRNERGPPNTDIRVGVYVNVRPDCTSGPLPSIQLTSPPENGKVTVKKARVTATNYKQCLALEVLHSPRG
jgi:hypothetical protein